MSAKHAPGPRFEIGWQLLGQKVDFSIPPTASLLRAMTSKAVVRCHIGGQYNVTEEFYVWHSNRTALPWPWKVSKRQIVGSRGSVEMTEDLDEFRTFREAIADAKERAQAAVNFAKGKVRR